MAHANELEDIMTVYAEKRQNEYGDCKLYKEWCINLIVLVAILSVAF
jgi:hypothetical protein